MGDAAGAEDGDLGQRAADHGDFVAAVQARAALAVFEDLVGESDLSSTMRKPYLKKKSGMRVNRQTDWMPWHFGFFNERAQDAAACALAFGLGLDDDGADFAEVRSVEVQRAAAEEDAAVGFGNGEVADVFADFGEAASEQRAVAGERVDEVVDVEASWSGLYAPAWIGWLSITWFTGSWQRRRPFCMQTFDARSLGVPASQQRACGPRSGPLTRSLAVPPMTSWQSSVAARETAAKKSHRTRSPSCFNSASVRVVEFELLSSRKANSVADLLVGCAEGNAFVDEIGGGGHGIEVAGLRGFASCADGEVEGRG